MRPRRAAPGVAVLAAGVVAAAVALGASAAGMLVGPEQDSVAARFQLRGEEPVDDVAVVAIDDVTFSELGRSWPFPRRLHARALDALRRAGARAVVYDIQFTEQTRPADDNALYAAVARFPGTILATTETDGKGRHNVFNGAENTDAAGAHVGAANLASEAKAVVQRYRYAEGGLETLGVVAARTAGPRALTPADFPPGGAWIDFRGPPGTIPTVSFSRLLSGRADANLLRDRIVVVGAAAPTLQDVHATPTSADRLMSGPEVQANAIWTALHGLPMRESPAWVGWLATLLLGLLPTLAVMRGRAARALLIAPLLAVAWLLAVQATFEQHLILPVAAPLLALLLGTVSASTIAFVLERDRSLRAASYSAQLERAVSARTEELRETQLEIVSRLGRAVESRDADTGEHVDRMSRLCEQLALAVGMPPAEAELLRHAAALHDVGKVGIPDAILRKPGRFDAEERAAMERHTLIGAAILSGSASRLVALAATIARSHHERWDGTGYPERLAGEAIPLPARIVAVCDVYDALLSPRPYKQPWSVAEARAELLAQRGRHFDPALVDAFLALELGAGAPAPELGVLTLQAPDAAPGQGAGGSAAPARR